MKIYPRARPEASSNHAGTPIRLGASFLASIGLAVLTYSAPSQVQPTAPRPLKPINKLSYDVSTVRLSKPGSSSVGVDLEPDRFSATNAPLLTLIQNAYGIRQDLITGGPGWLNSTRFDVQAKISDADANSLNALSDSDRRKMFQAVLKERFHLRVHTEERVGPVFTLLVGKGGPKIREVPPGNEPPDLNGVAAGGMKVEASMLTAHDVPISALADLLAYRLQRTVLDNTGLKGKYDILLAWGSAANVVSGDAVEEPSLFTVLQEQLGLKLEAAKAPVQVLVVDHAEIPTPN